MIRSHGLVWSCCYRCQNGNEDGVNEFGDGESELMDLNLVFKQVEMVLHINQVWDQQSNAWTGRDRAVHVVGCVCSWI